MFTVEDRERIRSELLALARNDPRLTGGAVTLLPREVTQPLEDALVLRIEAAETSRAFEVASSRLLVETRLVNDELAGRLEPAIHELCRR